MTESKRILKAIQAGIDHAKKEILSVDPSLDPICVQLIAQFAAAKAIDVYTDKIN